ncbi:hypothetical protein JY651_35390 [Pyxidicoccus parkwayensis]|uniref:CARDB domain-containing protein n=1 Tax=Pyxidicoccus parkwayensis TaxID=2813578 RepID=A0ABX7NSW0_9BACT|nr:hypothetical protein [Pyxidicoccus parkwaysis]QSQ20494.1 hypothetical protein JY651_35390 [Pyxidicoccus parkwaysis]
MRLKSLLLLAALLFIQLPLAARAAPAEGFDWCGTPYPKWWWGKKGLPPGPCTPENWRIEPAGADFRIAVDIVNRGTTTCTAGMAFAVTHAAVDPTGYPDPASGAAPADARSVLGTETLAQGTLPALRPGETFTVTASARGIREGANHLLTVAFLDGADSRPSPEPTPWFWVNFENVDPAASLRLVATRMEPVTSTRPGYTAHRVYIGLQNVGREDVSARTPILVVHGNAASAGGYWGPDDDTHGPNDPGNPYAIIYREVLFRGAAGQTVRPGETLTVQGIAFSPEGTQTQKQLAVKVGG